MPRISSHMGPDCLTIEEAAAYAGVPPHSIRSSIYTKALRILPERVSNPTGIGRKRVLIAKADLLAWMAEREQKQALQKVERERERSRAERRAAQRAAQDPARPRPGSKARCNRRLAEFGELLKRTREQLDLSISEVARRADTCQSYVSRMESLGEVPRREKVLAIAQALGVDPNPFLLVCGYAPEKDSHLGDLLAELTRLQPQEQALAWELAATYVRGSGPERSSLLSFVRWWRQAPESERRRQWGEAVRAG